MKLSKKCEFFFCCAILGSALVFVEKQEKADMLFKDLLKTSYPCLSLHGGKMYGLLTKCEGSRWLDIGRVLFFLRVYGLRRSRGPYTRKKRTRPISSHLDRTNLVNKGFIIWLSGKILRDKTGSPERAR